MRYILLSCLLIFSFSLFSQSTFQSYFGENIPFTESYDLLQTEDGGFLVTGTSMNEDLNSDVYILKIDKDGLTDWIIKQDFDNGIFTDVANSVIETDDKFIVLGYGWEQGASVFGSFIIHLSKQNGEIIKFINLTSLFDISTFYQILQKSEDKLILIGYDSQQSTGLSMTPFTMVELDYEGNVQWVQHYENSLSGGTTDFYFGGLEKKGDYLYAGFGGSNPDSTSIDIHAKKLSVIKTDSLGNLNWLNEIPNTHQATNVALSNNRLIASSSISTQIGKGVILSFDQGTGDLLWQKSYEEYVDSNIGCVVNSKDEIICAGDKSGVFSLIKTDIDGNLIWNKTFEPFGSIEDFASRSIVLTEDEGVAVTGNIYMDGIPGPRGIFIFRLNSEGEFGEIVNTQTTPLHNFQLEVFPNPTSDFLYIKNKAEKLKVYQLTIYDSQGKRQVQDAFQGAEKKVNIQHLTSGMYIVELRTNENQIWQTMVVKE